VEGPVDQYPNRARQIQNRAAVPPFPKCVLEIGYCRARDGDLHTVPRRMLSVRCRELHRLPIAHVGRVVAPAPTEVYTAEEGDVGLRATRITPDDQFLMVRSRSTRARVEQNFAPRVRQLPSEFGALTFALVEPARLRTPDQSEHEHTASRYPAEYLTDGSAWPVEDLLGVLAVIGEVDLVAGPGASKCLTEATEVHGAVDQRLNSVAAGPGADVRCWVAQLLICQEPALDTGILIIRHGSQFGLNLRRRPERCVSGATHA
jgi:hypothetical protein